MIDKIDTLMEQLEKNPIETWHEMTVRHRRERYEMVEKLSKDYTQTQAAKMLGTTLQNLNMFIKRNGIEWRIIKQGVRL
jgi:transcriptional regulator with GAF, ATPase, and Fis domain